MENSNTTTLRSDCTAQRRCIARLRIRITLQWLKPTLGNHYHIQTNATMIPLINPGMMACTPSVSARNFVVASVEADAPVVASMVAFVGTLVVASMVAFVGASVVARTGTSVVACMVAFVGA